MLTNEEIDRVAENHFTLEAKVARWQARNFARAAIAAHSTKVLEGVEPVAWLHIQGRHSEPSIRELLDEEIERGWTQEPLYSAATVAALQSRVSELEKDAWRLDWILQQGDDYSFGLLIDQPDDGKFMVVGQGCSGIGDTPRAAIDAARAAKGTP